MLFFKRTPTAPASPAPTTETLPPPAAPAAPSASAQTGAARTVILVVDDSTVIRTAVVRALTAQNYELIEADDGTNGLAAWEKDKARISLVISDVFMPRTDGLTMARELRKRSRTLPIILMSSKLDEDSRWIAEEAGFRLLPKPFKDALLIELVARILRLRTSA